MSAAAFAYALVLCRPEAKDELMALLPEDRRTEISATLEKIKELSPERIRTELNTLRAERLICQRESAQKHMAIEINRVAPKLRAWLTRPF